MLQPELCRQRQRRLLKAMEREKLRAIVLGSAHHVFYFTGYRSFWLHEAAFVLRDDGASWLVCGNEPTTQPPVGNVIQYVSNWHSTQRLDHAAAVAEALNWLGQPDSLGIDASAVGSQLLLSASGARACDELLWQMRRVKDPDELALMRRAIACTEAMYRRASEIIEPGVTELRVYSELHAAAVEVAGEPLSPAYLGNDFACAERGGPPRGGHAANAGELYILDLGLAYRGYHSDNCRTFAVDRKPTDAQMAAWQFVIGVFPMIERMARPGVRCRDIYAAIDQHYRAGIGESFPHHLGHGVGLQPHEFPHLNPHWDDVLMEGEVFTVEPGLYRPDLRAGIRVENQYLLTATGIENLTPFPMELVR